MLKSGGGVLNHAICVRHIVADACGGCYFFCNTFARLTRCAGPIDLLLRVSMLLPLLPHFLLRRWMFCFIVVPPKLKGTIFQNRKEEIEKRGAVHGHINRRQLVVLNASLADATYGCSEATSPGNAHWTWLVRSNVATVALYQRRARPATFPPQIYGCGTR